MLLPAVAAGMIMMGAQAQAAPQMPEDPAQPAMAQPQPIMAAPVPMVQPLPGVVQPVQAQAPQPGVVGMPTGQTATIFVPPPVFAQTGMAGTPQAGSVQGGDIVVTGEKGAPPGDPLEALNEQSFEAVQSVDKALIQPVAQAYNDGLPRPVRKGLRNFFSNIGEPIVAAAYLLQFKPGKAIETVGRFGVNSTLGFLGLFDVAKRKPFNLPHRENGLANTLGYYGIGPGPYMYLPLIGGTTVRDLIGDTFDRVAFPLAIGAPFNDPAFVIPAAVLNQLGERAAFDETIQDIRQQDNPYRTYREMYLKQRQAEIDGLHGRAPAEPVRPLYGPGIKTPADN